MIPAASQHYKNVLKLGTLDAMLRGKGGLLFDELDYLGDLSVRNISKLTVALK